MWNEHGEGASAMQFKRSLTSRNNIDMIPMIDIVFQLILFFLVSTTFAMLPGISLNLPPSSTAENTEVTSLSVTVINENEIYLNKDRISFEHLASALINKYTEEQSVTLEADKSVSYGLIIEVLDMLRTGGFENINLHTMEKR